MHSLTLEPIAHIGGEVTLPGSKSLTNRALLLGALASGNTRLSNVLRSDDTDRMVDALRQLGVSVSFDDSGLACEVRGEGGLFQAPNEVEFFLGNAGTAIRPLTAVLAMMPGNFVVDGDEYMRERPIGHLTDALASLGARIRFRGKPGYPPFEIAGGSIKGGEVSLPGNISSQFLTSLLIALPLASRDSEVTVIGEQVSKPYLDITLDIMQRFGVTASHENYQRFRIPGQQQYQSPGSMLIEGDASSASYFFGAAAISGDTIRVNGVGSGSVQGDVAFLDVIEEMGATVQRYEDHVDVTGGELRGVDLDLNHIPDAAMTLATMALFADGPTRIRNIYNWRVKETDRMTAIATELRKLGATVETGDDYIVIEPPEQIMPAAIDTYGDHRIAMAFSLAAFGDQPITINDPDCTRKTFPDYFDVLASITRG